MPPLSLAVPLALCVILAGCASEPVMQDGIRVNDPFETQNRRVHAFNKAFDQRVIAPVANLASSDDQAPGGPGALDLVINAGANLSLPGKVANSILQGRAEPAIRNFFRFAVNTTLGMGGLLDPAGQDFGLTEQDTDFGQTLAVWGADTGPYLVLPALGPSNMRDAVGTAVDWATLSFAIPSSILDKTLYDYAPTGLQPADARYRVPFRYNSTGSPFEYELVRYAATIARKIEINSPSPPPE